MPLPREHTWPVQPPATDAEQARRREWAAALRYAATNPLLRDVDREGFRITAGRIEAGSLTPWAHTLEPATPLAEPAHTPPAAAAAHPGAWDILGVAPDWTGDLTTAEFIREVRRDKPARARATPGTPDSVPGVLGRALLRPPGNQPWLLARSVPEVAAPTEVLLVRPEVARVLAAALTWRRVVRFDSALWASDALLAAAVDALDGDQAPNPLESTTCPRHTTWRDCAVAGCPPSSPGLDALTDAERAQQQRAAARDETTGVREELTRTADEVDDLRRTLAVRTGELEAARRRLSEILLDGSNEADRIRERAELVDLREQVGDLEAERDRHREHAEHLVERLDAATSALADAGARADGYAGQVVALEAELATARRIIRTNPDMRLSWVPTDRLADYEATARRGGAADALEWVSGQPLSRDLLTGWATEIRNGDRVIPASSEPASREGGDDA